jgi:hypothetical protein
MNASALASISKEFPLALIDKTIEGIQPDMAYSDLLSFARITTHKDIPGVVRSRWLLLASNNPVAYDHFLSLVRAHGISSPLVRKVMYFTWVYRDTRLREFIK